MLLDTVKETLKSEIAEMYERKPPTKILKKLTYFKLLKSTSEQVFLSCTSYNGTQACSGSYSYYRKLNESRRLKPHNEWCSNGKDLYNRKSVIQTKNSTVNEHRVLKEIERLETEDITTVMNALMEVIDDSKKPQEDSQPESLPDSQKSWENESKEPVKITNKDKLKRAEEYGGSLMEKFRKKIKDKKREERDFYEKKKIIEKDQIFAHKRRKVNENDDFDLPLFDDLL